MFVNTYINTAYSGNCINYFHINNACSFPAFLTGELSGETSYSTTYSYSQPKKEKQKISKSYSIALDWFQFVCSAVTGTLKLSHLGNFDILVDRIITYHNPNFLECYRVSFQGEEMFELYKRPTNGNYRKDELLIKLSNQLLYTTNWTERVEVVLLKMNLAVLRVNSIAIAIDGEWNLKILDCCRRYLRTHTMQISNDNIDISPKKFRKNKLCWDEYLIGSRNSQKFCRVYDKTSEIQDSKKDYIQAFWRANGIYGDRIGRFELQLQWQVLRKYRINSFKAFEDPALLADLFIKEVKDWIEFRTVKLEYLRRHKKEIAFAKGKKKQLVWWNNLPTSQNQLQKIEVQPRRIENAKRSITTFLNEIRDHPNTSTTQDYVRAIGGISRTYSLEDWRCIKTNEMFSKNGIDPYPIFSGLTSMG